MKLLAAIGAVAAVLVVLPLVMVLIAAGIVAPAVVAGVLCGPTTPAAEDLPSGGWRPPLTSRYRLTSPYGRRLHPVDHVWRLHTGQDLAGHPAGSAVVAAAGGTVAAAGWGGPYGNRVILSHGNQISTMYGHLARIDPRIRPGGVVAAGQRLGVEGSTGTATGIHLHFQIERSGRPVDPVRFMRDQGVRLDGRAVRGDARIRVSRSATVRGLDTDAGEGGIGFDLPKPGSAAAGLAAQSAAADPGPDREAVPGRRPRSTGFRGRCSPGSAWKKPGTAATTGPAPPAHKA